MFGQVKIISGPTALGTTVLLVMADGEEIDISGCVRYIKWACSASEPSAEVTLEVVPGEVELVGKLKAVLEVAEDDADDIHDVQAIQ